MLNPFVRMEKGSSIAILQKKEKQPGDFTLQAAW